MFLKVGRRLIRRLNRRAGVLTITPSIGFSLWVPDKADIERLIRETDEAMYQAKRSGRNQVCRHGEALPA
ncbi:diguanylate cyclase domain-containing protein [Craterilacuibacter sp.]|uniref:diguanylate cyclase domain-containing protein n=1 Tax=Craterilacuibacter sp. TaxID=2870909 RepID=UPI003F33755A